MDGMSIAAMMHTTPDTRYDVHQQSGSGAYVVGIDDPQGITYARLFFHNLVEFDRFVRAVNDGQLALTNRDRAERDHPYGDAATHLCDDECGDPEHPRDGRVVPDDEDPRADGPSVEQERAWDARDEWIRDAGSVTGDGA